MHQVMLGVIGFFPRGGESQKLDQPSLALNSVSLYCVMSGKKKNRHCFKSGRIIQCCGRSGLSTSVVTEYWGSCVTLV